MAGGAGRAGHRRAGHAGIGLTGTREADLAGRALGRADAGCATVSRAGAAGAAVERSRHDDRTSAAHPARCHDGRARRRALLKIATEREERDDGPGDQRRVGERRGPHVLVVGTVERKMSKISWRRMTTSPHVGAGCRRRAKRPTRQASDASDRRRPPAIRVVSPRIRPAAVTGRSAQAAPSGGPRPLRPSRAMRADGGALALPAEGTRNPIASTAGPSKSGRSQAPSSARSIPVHERIEQRRCQRCLM